MKKRIKEVIDSDGNSIFSIQTKFIFWFDSYGQYFLSKEEAERTMNYERVKTIIIHET